MLDVGIIVKIVFILIIVFVLLFYLPLVAKTYVEVSVCDHDGYLIVEKKAVILAERAHVEVERRKHHAFEILAHFHARASDELRDTQRVLVQVGG